MTDQQTQPIDLRDALDKHLNARSLSKSISTLLLSKRRNRKTIDYSPYYQRNYVWDRDKGTFFIESILLGIEIPPLIMFIPANEKRKYEVIDGRQRYETLKQFFDGDFRLTKNGLRSLTDLKGLNFHALDLDIQRIFLDTTIRIIEFSTIGDNERQEELEDKIKKEIFWRYNSGITPLKTLDVQRAQHLDDKFTEVMDREFDENPRWLKRFKKVFLSKKSLKEPSTEECQAKIRELLVLAHFPINNYASTSNRRDTVEWLYDLYIERAENQYEILENFKQKVELLYQLFIVLNEKEWMIYQGVYWSLVILEQNNIDMVEFFEEKTIQELVVMIKNNLSVFTGDSRGFSDITKKRFNHLADFFKIELNNKNLNSVEFSPYLKGSLKKYSENNDAKKSIDQLENMGLNRHMRQLMCLNT